MSEKQLLLSPANPGAPISKSRYSHYLRITAILAGAVVVLVGAADVTSRAARFAFPGGVASAAFAPAAALADPSSALFANALATTTPLLPARLSIPAIGVDAPVERVGKKADGSMATPGNFTDVAWYALGSRPGQAGSAVMAGHVNNALTTAGVFEHLSDLKLGDRVSVADAQGRTLTYIVRETDTYPADQAPTAAIFSTAGPSQLVLITCDGQWDAAAHSFDRRFVAYASLVNS